MKSAKDIALATGAPSVATLQESAKNDTAALVEIFISSLSPCIMRRLGSGFSAKSTSTSVIRHNAENVCYGDWSQVASLEHQQAAMRQFTQKSEIIG